MKRKKNEDEKGNEKNNEKKWKNEKNKMKKLTGNNKRKKNEKNKNEEGSRKRSFWQFPRAIWKVKEGKIAKTKKQRKKHGKKI